VGKSTGYSRTTHPSLKNVTYTVGASNPTPSYILLNAIFNQNQNSEMSSIDKKEKLKVGINQILDQILIVVTP